MIEDARVLREGFVPSDVVHGGAEVNALSRVLEPVTDGYPAESTLITDPSGTGKTTITKFVVGRLRGYSVWAGSTRSAANFVSPMWIINSRQSPLMPSVTSQLRKI